MQPQPPDPSPADIRTQIRDAIRARVGDEPTTDAAPAARVVIQPTQEVPDIPPRVADVAIIMTIAVVMAIVFYPLARAVARWIDRRGQAPARLPGEVTGQLAQLSQAVDAIAVEVERISEGQRFTTKLLSDTHAQREAIAAPRSEER